MEQQPSEILQLLWQFVRGDMPVAHFERWAYENSAIEDMLGADLYFELISTPFSSPEAVELITRRLREFAEGIDVSPCRCQRVANVAVIDMGDHEDIFRSFESISKRGEPYWWLSAYSCSECGQAWLVAQEERQNDVFCLRRLSAEECDRVLQQNQWPADFDRYESLLSLGCDAGRSVRFVDPLNSSIRFTVVDLAREHPGIGVSELAALLNIERPLAEELALRAVDTTGVQINLEK